MKVIGRVLFMACALFIGTSIVLSTVEAGSKQFSDVLPTNPNYKIIHSMAEQGIIGGYEDGTFRPDAYITRQQAAALISRAFPVLPKVYDWEETPEITSKSSYYGPLRHLYEGGLLDWKVENIRPKDNLTRAEMAGILAYTAGVYYKEDYKKIDHPFKDLELPNDRLEVIINRTVLGLYFSKITTGYPDGTFRPYEPVTRAQFAVFMHCAQENKHEFADYIYKIKAFQYKSAKEVPLPKGYKNKEELKQAQQQKFKAFSNEHLFAYSAGTTLQAGTTKYEFTHTLTRLKNAFLIDAEEIVGIINHVFETGEVYTFAEEGKRPFALYYDFSGGFLSYGSNPNPK